MTAPEDFLRGVCEITAGPGLDGQHLEVIREQKGKVPGADLVAHSEVSGITWSQMK